MKKSIIKKKQNGNGKIVTPLETMQGNLSIEGIVQEQLFQ